MKTNSPFKPKTTLALLSIAIVLNAFSMFILFPRIETIIHGELYEYGLQSSFEWINPIRDSSHLFLNCLGISAILMTLSELTLAIYNRKRNTVLKAVSTVLVTTGVGMNLFSLYSFYQIDQIVNKDLYSFGLQLNEGWYSSYGLYSMQLAGFVVFASAISAVSIVLISLSARKDVNLVPEKIANSILIVSGTTSLALSIIYTSSILALIGLGMLFWGAIFTYVSNEEYVKKILLSASTSSQLETVNKLIQETDFAGNAVFLPPRYFKIPETYKAYIQKDKNANLPTPEMFYRKDPRFSVEFIENPPAILITPPGAELVKLFEKELKTDFVRVDLQYLQVNLPQLLTDNLEIAQHFEMDIEKNTIRARIGGSVYREVTPDEQKLVLYFTFGSPLTSAIACVLAKVSGKPVMQVKRQTSPDGNLVVEYHILEKEEPQMP
jgi:hypothetical protein